MINNNKIPTAEEFLEKAGKGKGYLMLDRKEFTDCMKKFAERHVEAALEAAWEKGLVCLEDLDNKGRSVGSMEAKEINIIGKYIPSKVYLKKISILNAYDKNLII